MGSKLIKQVNIFCKRYSRIVAALLLGILIAVCGGSFLIDYRDQSMISEVTATSTGSTFLSRSSPQTLRIPAIDLAVSFEGPLGIKPDQTVEVPKSFTEVGWYTFGPTPGEIGPAVVLGHVDSYQGPAVFYRLKQLKPGDAIYIDRTDGETVTFIVDHLERPDQNNFPTAAVYGDVDHPALRLITCTGVYNHSILRYSHNLIVFADLAE